MKKNSLIYFILGLILVSCSSTKTIVEHPITFNEERKMLTLEYLQNRYGLEQDLPKIEPKMIVLHWTVIPTFEKSFEAFDPVTLPNWRPDIKNVSGLNVSSQFMVDRDGTIYQLLPETTMARHVIGLNHCAIGVENVGGTEELPLTKAQLKSNIWLVKYLNNKYDIDYLIGHYEYTLFENHPLWLEIDEGYRTVKTDPGPEFMDNVRKAVKSLDFKELPIK
ncbi:N-acetylmuramoyl-L-alanine amidase [Maribacter sp. 1_MG-2023]|uniref:N-acetylmuramoyl-L-alanine amidase n=1 Tax=Maribacter sp. 1_MG-2023 TaxID=3062677 RepID=UPI0026E33C30|nr:peptidoglycan recognition family protein [Maribacter sp. 1_MG-2023]MDO6473272.1 peptidoglycan recognition family protein [Maribacter sp. 1_MG-2023]